jgi:tetratricopeptide (TPR) repeat protein
MTASAHDYAILARLMYFLGKPKEALRVFDEGLSDHPGNVVLLRYRGHQLITERAFAAALADLTRAAAAADDTPDELEFYRAQVEGDLANMILRRTERIRRYPVPVSEKTLLEFKDTYKGSLKASIWYHLGLVRYLTGDFAAAAEAYRRALTHCVDDDMTVATVDWLYASLRRAANHDEAHAVLDLVNDDMHIIEHSYLNRVRVYLGRMKPEALLQAARTQGNFATQAYGVANWYRVEARHEEAEATYRTILNDAPPTAFGYIASEIDLASLTALSDA